MQSDALIFSISGCPETCNLKNNFARKVTRLLKHGQAHFLAIRSFQRFISADA
jgi:hypothetical protein